MRALILGGTGQARALAKRLVDAGWFVTSSLAGRVSEPKLPVGHVRIGGFGGPAGLATWLIADATEIIIDATHPYAERISESAAEAALATGIPLIALHRPAWEKAQGDNWIEVKLDGGSGTTCSRALCGPVSYYWAAAIGSFRRGF